MTIAAMPASIVVGAFDPEGWPAMLVGLVFLGIIGWLANKDVSSPRAIRLTPETVQNLDQWRWHNADVDQLNAADIENLRIHQTSKGGRVVVIESDRGSMHVGQGLSREDLAWLRDFLVAEIARRARRDF